MDFKNVCAEINSALKLYFHQLLEEPSQTARGSLSTKLDTQEFWFRIGFCSHKDLSSAIYKPS